MDAYLMWRVVETNPCGIWGGLDDLHASLFASIHL